VTAIPDATVRRRHSAIAAASRRSAKATTAALASVSRSPSGNRSDSGAVLAAVALPNEASIALHGKTGFEEVGTFRAYGNKTGERRR
jgi:predicted GNAT superfamily acetyltransferase